MSWYIKALKNILNFQGRAQRKEYWYFTLFMYIFGLLLVYFLFASIFDSIDFDSFGEDEPPTEEEIEAMMGGGAGWAIKGIFFNIFIFAHAIAALSVTVRRLHDTNRSAWWLLISFVPIAQIVMLVFMLMPSYMGSNQYGPNPLGGYDDDDEYDDYPEDEYYDDDEPAPVNRGQTQKGQRPAQAGHMQRKYADRHAPISDEGLDYSDRFNTHGAEVDNTQIDRRFGLIESPAADEHTPEAGSLDYIEFPSDVEESFSDTLGLEEKTRRLDLLAGGGLSLEAPPPERAQPAPAPDKNWEPSAPRNISSIEAEEPGINERFGLMDQAPQAGAPAAKTPRYISALPQQGQPHQATPPAGVQRPIARPSSPSPSPSSSPATAARPAAGSATPQQHPGIRPAPQAGMRPTGAPQQPMNRPVTGSTFGTPSVNPAVNRPIVEDPAFPDFEPTRQLRPAAPAATGQMQPPPRAAQAPQPPQQGTSVPPRAQAGMPPNTPQHPAARPAVQPGQRPVRPAAQYSNPLAHTGNDALGRSQAGLKPAPPRRPAPSRGTEQSPSDEPENMWSKFLPKK